MKPGTLTHYARRLDPVLRWLASHPDADPDLHRLADLACLSPYHFHRVYRAMMGETVNATVQRIRMHRAAAALAGSQVSLREVAQRAGYESDAAFNRAFGAVFGMAPGRYRAARSRPFDPQELGMYPITIENFPGVILAALPHRGSYQDIGPVFDRAFMLAASRGLAARDACGYGVYFDDPNRCRRASCVRWPACPSRPTSRRARVSSASRSRRAAARCWRTPAPTTRWTRPITGCSRNGCRAAAWCRPTSPCSSST